jgi:hypothetical protein
MTKGSKKRPRGVFLVCFRGGGANLMKGSVETGTFDGWQCQYIAFL